MKRPAILLAVALTLLFAAISLKSLLVPLPDVPAQADGSGFDADRALSRLARILGDESPHPVDSRANDAVRARLVEELAALGLSPVVSDRRSCNGVTRSRLVGCARIRNVRATIGPAEGRHVLVVSHYDSSPVGPGAADDGIGVAAMLEIAAVLKERPLARPVTFLFDEGEELQLNGARAFLESDPLAARVDSAVNLEARGVTGPAIMFETSQPNAGAIALFAGSAWHPVANSLTAGFYSLIPNDTDVSVFKTRRWLILNFAIIGNETRYHSAGDTIAALDRRSLAHMGVQALRATEAMARAPARTSLEDRVYAPIPGGLLVNLSQTLAVMAVFLCLVPALALAWTRRAGRAAAALLASLAAAGMAAFLLQTLTSALRPGAFWRAFPAIVSGAIDLTALAVAVAMLASLGRPLEREKLRAGFWLSFLLIGAGLCLLVPGASIFFVLPPATAMLGVAAEHRWPGAARSGAVAAWLLLFLSWAPLLHLGEVLLDFTSGWIFAPLAALVLLPALIELKPLTERLSRRVLAAACASAAIAGWAATLAWPAYSADRRQMFVLSYEREAGAARWLVLNDGARLPTAFARFEKGAEVSWSRRRHWAAPAPLLPIAAPTLEWLGERPHPLGRVVRLRLGAAGADALVLRGDAEAGFIAARVGGSVARFGAGKAKEPFYLRCAGRSCDGMVVDLLVARHEPIPARLIGLRYALPPQAGPLLAARPPDSAPHYMPDATVALRDVRL